MNYIGSKFKLSAWIRENVIEVAGSDLDDKIFCDLFAGTGIVGRSFKKDVRKVIANDIEYYSFVLNRNYIGNASDLEGKMRWIEHLNALSPKEGFIYRHYCAGSGSGRNYFSDANGKKIDAIRQEIARLRNERTIDEDTYYYLLASLIESADKVANTASVYGAFLKHIKKSAQKEIVLESADFLQSGHSHEVYQEESNTLIERIEGDILYLDPPYNSRQYGANYHLLNTIAHYDSFTPKGKTGLRDYTRSAYCSKRSVNEAFDDLLEKAQFRYIFLSYNNEGLMSEEDVKRIMQKYGRYSLATKSYQRFKADKTENRNHKASGTYEYLHILEKF